MTDLVPTLDEIRHLEEALHRPQVRRSKEALEALLADGFFEFGASGNIYRRAEIIDLLIEEGDGDNGDLETGNYELATISDGAVLLTYESRRTHSDGLRRHALRSSIWKHDGQKWQMFFHQGTIRQL